MTTFRIATAQPVGITDPSSLDPSSMSSGAASAGEVLTADGAGGAAWSAEAGLGDVSGPAGATDGRVVVFSGATGKAIKEPVAAVDFAGQNISNVGSVSGHVPTTRAINNGTGISGGGDLSADRTLSVVESALDPANMSSGSATVDQVPAADGAGGISWQDQAAAITTPGTTTDDALVRWDGTTGLALANSGVTLSDAAAMVFPSTGSISKPSTGTGSEAFGVNASADGTNSVALGNGAKVQTVSTGNNTGGIAIGVNAAVGQASLAGASAGLAIGSTALVQAGSVNSVAVGPSAQVQAGATQAVAVGSSATVTGSGTFSTALGSAAFCGASNAAAFGRSALVSTGSTGGTAFGAQSEANASNVVALGFDATVYAAGTGDNIGAICLGAGSMIGSASGAGCNASIAIGENVAIPAGVTDAVGLGPSAAPKAANAICVGLTSVVHNPGTGSNAAAIVIGASSTAGADAGSAVGSSVIVGALSSVGAGAQNCVVLGPTASVGTGTYTEAIAIGKSTSVTGDHAICIGNDTSTATAANAVALGRNANATHSESVAIGRNAASTAATRCTIGTIAGSFDMELQIGKGLGVFGVTPPSSQPAHIADVTGTAGATYTSTEQTMINDLKTAVNAILLVIEGAGLNASV